MMKKFLAVIMSAVILFTLVGCAKGDSNSPTADKGSNTASGKKESITLLYSLSDSFNPYESITDQNREITKLIFEPLIRIDNEFNVVLALAKDVKIEGAVCTVTLKNVSFSDGSTLTSDDVVYSCKAAQASNSIYKSKLYEVKSVVAANRDTVVFTLAKADPYFKNLLDFPIFKSGSDKIVDEDSVKQVPIGCGKYVFNSDKTELVQNKKYYGGSGNIEKIKLINAPDRESVAHYVEIGATDIYFNDISDGEIIRMSGHKSDINLNNLVYIGVNHSYGALSLSELRQAISSGINRNEICGDAFYNNAVSANGFFTPVWDATKSVQNIQTSSNSQITIENLEEIGYNSLDSEGVRRNGGRSLKFSLMVNKENRSRVNTAKMVADQLKAYGIKITVLEVSFNEYINRLQNGNFQLYLGEVKVTENMDLSPLIVAGGSAAFGMKNTAKNEDKEEKGEEENAVKASSSADIINLFYKGNAEITDVVSVLQTEMPIIPVCYRLGVLFSKEGINIGDASQNDIFLNIK